MRDFLIRHRLPDDYEGYSLTLTIPGPAVEWKEAKDLFWRFSKALEKMEGCSVWRVEIQPEREQLHWHVMVGLPAWRRAMPIDGWEDLSELSTKHREMLLNWYKDGVSLNERRREQKKSELNIHGPAMSGRWLALQQLREKWLKALSGLPVVHQWKGQKDVTPDQIRGARLFSCIGEVMRPGDSDWIRYLYDHSTKRKQEQIAENAGRHWGVTSRKRFAEILPEQVNLSAAQYYRFLRAHQRLTCGQIKAEKAAFGKRVAPRKWYGRIGTYVAFGSTDTLSRLAAWAATTPERNKWDAGPEPARGPAKRQGKPEA